MSATCQQWPVCTKCISYHQTNAHCPPSAGSSRWGGWRAELGAGPRTGNWAGQRGPPALAPAGTHRTWPSCASPEPEQRLTQWIIAHMPLTRGTSVHKSNSFPRNRSDMPNSPQAQPARHGRHTNVLASKALQAQDIRLSFFSSAHQSESTLR